jgi:ATP:ADP antiporter, AAA family
MSETSETVPNEGRDIVHPRQTIWKRAGFQLAFFIGNFILNYSVLWFITTMLYAFMSKSNLVTSLEDLCVNVSLVLSICASVLPFVRWVYDKVWEFLWPVYPHERKKFIGILLIAFFISFNYNILRTAKDTLVVTARGSGAEAIPFIKVWVLLPMAFLLTYIFTKLSNRYSREKVFYVLITLFLVFFSFFIFVLYPARDVLHPHDFIDSIQGSLPHGAQGFLALFRNWTFTCYYVMSELWGNIILSLLFWGFANEVTNVKEAKRFYSLLGLSLNIGGICSGKLSVWFSKETVFHHLVSGKDVWESTLILLITAVLICGVIIMVLFRWMNKTVIANCPIEKKKSKEKIKMTMRENFAYIAKSRYLLYLALIVLAYNLVINLVEVVWKGELKQLYPIPGDYNMHMSQVTFYMSVLSTIISLAISGQSIRKFGWTFTALITPTILLVASCAFFFFFFVKVHAFDFAYGFIGMHPLMITVFIGSTHNCFCRAAKYTVFDTTKEMAFIPLSKECKRRGKAAIDGVGSRMGKSGGSLIHQGLLMMCSTLTVSAPYVASIVIIAAVIWVYAVKALGKRFNDLIEHHETIDLSVQDENKCAVVTPQREPIPIQNAE